jgi:hypothetical protein
MPGHNQRWSYFYAHQVLRNEGDTSPLTDKQVLERAFASKLIKEKSIRNFYAEEESNKEQYPPK